MIVGRTSNRDALKNSKFCYFSDPLVKVRSITIEPESLQWVWKEIPELINISIFSKFVFGRKTSWRKFQVLFLFVCPFLSEIWDVNFLLEKEHVFISMLAALKGNENIVPIAESIK